MEVVNESEWGGGINRYLCDIASEYCSHNLEKKNQNKFYSE